MTESEPDRPRTPGAADPSTSGTGPAGSPLPGGGGGSGAGGTSEPLTVEARPVRLRRIAVAMAAAVVVTFAVLAFLLGNTRSEGVVFGPSDQVAMLVLGLIVAGGVLVVAGPSVRADVRGLRVRNILVSRDVPWEAVREVVFRDGSPWAVLELADDDQVALLAIQAADRERAVAAVRGLRALQARHAAGRTAGPRLGRTAGPAAGRTAGSADGRTAGSADGWTAGSAGRRRAGPATDPVDRRVADAAIDPADGRMTGPAAGSACEQPNDQPVDPAAGGSASGAGQGEDPESPRRSHGVT